MQDLQCQRILRPFYLTCLFIKGVHVFLIIIGKDEALPLLHDFGKEQLPELCLKQGHFERDECEATVRQQAQVATDLVA